MVLLDKKAGRRRTGSLLSQNLICFDFFSGIDTRPGGKGPLFIPDEEIVLARKSLVAVVASKAVPGFTPATHTGPATFPQIIPGREKTCAHSRNAFCSHCC